MKEICKTDKIKANFLTQTQGSEVPTHTDVGTLCAINFILGFVNLIASSKLRVPIPVACAVFIGWSNEILTCDWAA